MDQVRYAAEIDRIKPTAWIRRLVEAELARHLHSEDQAASDLEARVSSLEVALAQVLASRR
jgi:hypothetical protein